MNRISKRYAQALFQVALDKNSLDSYEQQLKECINIIHSSEAIYQILSNPENSYTMKTNLIDRLFGSSVERNIINLLKLLIDKERLDILTEILIEYSKEMRLRMKSLDVTAISAFPLQSDEINSIKSKLKNKYNVSEINLVCEVDQNLIGGFKLIIGNEVIDSSVKGIMDAMKNQVMSR
ncbi:F0F1 ATP synthase subunit delta [Petroclostridium xylanilyticum]|uniref:F0F1 ATP synthase subunit delta n=1 Tax=Petroclostridium xylanilyticum TaxID=1792311 RepID=UPI000B998E89|nr:F0F1 ATP synthase subunit delta [Petroclostridium xylanilyticum]